MLGDESFAKDLQIFETCISVTTSSFGKLVSSLEFLIKLDGRFKVTSVPSFIEDFNFKLLIRQFYIKRVILSHF